MDQVTMLPASAAVVAETEIPRKAGRREWIGLGVIALPCLLYSMDMTVLNLAVPHIAADLRPSASQMLWIVDIYGFMVAGALITMGTLGDRIGRRKLLLIGAVAFGVASVLAAFSTSAEMLIAARAILGLAAATLAPSTLSLIRNMFPDPAERTVAIGVWISSFSAGSAIGPLVGGVLLTWFWWGSVFLVAVPIMIALLIAGPLLLPEFRDEEAGRMDISSAALATGAVLAVIYGLKRFAESGVEPMALAAAALGIALGTVFVRRQNRLTDPLIDLGMFRLPAFVPALAINVLGFFAAFGTFLLTAQYLQLVLGLSPLQAGLVSLPSAAAFIAGSMLTPGLAARYSVAGIMATGYLLSALGFVMLTAADATWPLPLLVAGYFVMSLGLAPVFTLATDLIIGLAPAERAGQAAGMAETSSEFGGALGIAVLGSLVTAIYRAQVAPYLPDNLVADQRHAALDTVGGALAEAAAIGGEAGEAVSAAARLAYADAFTAACLVCTVLAVAAALAAWFGLRRAAHG